VRVGPVTTGMVVLGLLAPAAAGAKTLKVDDDRAQCPGAPYTSIQPAVNAAADGDVISVCRGVYAGQVVVPRAKKNLSLRSVTALGATLHGPAAGISAGDGNPSATVVLRGDRLLVRGFRIAGPTAYADPDQGCSNHTHPSAVAVPEGSATLDSNRIFGAAVTCQGETGGAGVWEGDVDGTFTLDTFGEAPPVVTVDRNAFVGSSGVIAEGGSRVTVQRNTMSGNGTGFFLGESYEQAPRVTATVRTNTFSGYAAGVSVRIGGRVLVAGNTLRDNGTGIQLEDTGKGELRGNVIEGGHDGIVLGRPAGFGPVFDFLVRGNRVHGTSGNGIWARDASRNQLTDNRSLDNGGFDCLDETNGSRTAGTADTWARNIGRVDSPNVCKAP
jgi:nitrous oxidase accessory protein NosD